MHELSRVMLCMVTYLPLGILQVMYLPLWAFVLTYMVAYRGWVVFCEWAFPSDAPRVHRVTEPDEPAEVFPISPDVERFLEGMSRRFRR